MFLLLVWTRTCSQKYCGELMWLSWALLAQPLMSPKCWIQIWTQCEFKASYHSGTRPLKPISHSRLTHTDTVNTFWPSQLLQQLHFSFSSVADQRITLICCPLQKSSVPIHAAMDVSHPAVGCAHRTFCHGGVCAGQASRPRAVRRKVWLTGGFRLGTVRWWRKVKPRWSAVRHTTEWEVTENHGTEDSTKYSNNEENPNSMS